MSETIFSNPISVHIFQFFDIVEIVKYKGATYNVAGVTPYSSHES